jgi:hypothetical protein
MQRTTVLHEAPELEMHGCCGDQLVWFCSRKTAFYSLNFVSCHVTIFLRMNRFYLEILEIFLDTYVPSMSRILFFILVLKMLDLSVQPCSKMMFRVVITIGCMFIPACSSVTAVAFR